MVSINIVKKIIDYFYGVFMCNTMFLISNSFLLLLLIKNKTSSISLLEVYFVALLISPSLTALYYALGKLLRYEDISVVRNYVHGYKTNFIQSLWVGAFLYTPILMIVYSIRHSLSIVMYLQLIVLTVLVLMTLYIYPILSRFHIKIKALLILSFVSIFKQIKTTLSAVFIVIMFILVTLLYPSISVLFIFSCFGLTVMHLVNPFLEVLETLK